MLLFSDYILLADANDELREKFDVSLSWIFKVGKEENVPKIMRRGKTLWSKKHFDAILAHRTHDESESSVVVTNLRHYEALVRAQTSIRRVLDGLDANYPGDLLSQDIRETLHHLGEITGEITTDEILANIFQHFCIGK